MLEDIKDLISLCKRRGIIFQGSEIYGGLANTWDYGPIGVELKKNIKDTWWKSFVQDREDVLGLDSAILLNPRVWEASGHVGNFNDYLMDCKKCKARFRADKLIEEHMIAQGQAETTEHPHAEEIAALSAEMGGVLLPGDDVAESRDFHERVGGWDQS